MADTTILRIHLSDAGARPEPLEGLWNEHRGNREVLLRWLETQLGLLRATVSPASRVTQYATALKRVENASFAHSFKTDPWATASELLAKRDELCLAGWDETESSALPMLVDETESSALPMLVCDLARASKAAPLTFPSEAERLRAVVAALNDGQRLPSHRCVLADPGKRWPKLWQDVLKRLNVESAPTQQPLAAETTTLGKIQHGITSGAAEAVAFDPSFRWIGSRSLFAACEAITAALTAEPERIPKTIICCESETAALCLDSCLARAGLPTMGAGVRSLAHPALQVLPLTLALCWEPVDPILLLDFLSLPMGPIPKPAARKLAEALAEQPGLGSGAWVAAMANLCSDENDPDHSLREKLQTWLETMRTARGGRLPSDLVSELCGRVAQWAVGRAAKLEDDASQQSLRETLLLAAAQASTLGALVQTVSGGLTEPQLARLREAVMAQGAESIPFTEAVGGPRLVRSLSEIHHETDDLIWLGVGTAELSTPRWTAQELRLLRKQGIELDDGTNALAALRDAERRGLSRIRQRLLSVSVPTDQEQPQHPVWIQVLGMLPDKPQKPTAVPLEELLTGEANADRSAPWQFPTVSTPSEPSQPLRPIWNLRPGLLQERDSSSATELSDRLACPLKWVFNYAAKLAPSPIARLPNDFLLKGNFCHSVLRLVFGQDQSIPDEPEADRRVAEMFDNRLPLDAAPLAQPHRIADRQKLREELLTATRTLITTLRAGGYRSISLEVPIDAELDGRKLIGSIDCLATHDVRAEAVVDFKYGSKTKYRDFVKDGRAVQLATYSFARAGENDGMFPAAAYLMLSDGLLHTPGGSPMAGASNDSIHQNAPAISDVWQRFISALEIAGEWLNGREPVPARPLQPVAAWPQDALIVLVDPDSLPKSQEFKGQAVCQYCDYKSLCGIKELQ